MTYTCLEGSIRQAREGIGWRDVKTEEQSHEKKAVLRTWAVAQWESTCLA